MDTWGTDVVAEAQRRLQLVVRSQHGPAATALWARACTRAGALCTGTLTPEELRRVAAELLREGGAVAVAAHTCRVRLLFLHRREPALDEQGWLVRLAALEAEVTSGPG